MATIALGAVGFVLGGPLGAAVAAPVGLFIDRSFIFPVENTVRGPQLEDLTLQRSAFGGAITQAFGRARVGGNILWSSGLVEEEVRERSGSKGSRTTTIQYRYSVSFALGLAQGQIRSIGRIWADGKVLRDANGTLAVAGAVRFYDGREDQQPDPALAAALGSDNAPAFRGLAYVVFENLDLSEYANRIPTITVEINPAPAPDPTIAEILVDVGREIPTRVVADNLDVTVEGGVFSGDRTPADLIAVLNQITPFDIKERVGELRLVGRSDTTAASIIVSADELGTGDGEERVPAIERRRRRDLQAPREIAVRYFDRSRDYQVSVQRARRESAPTPRRDTEELPLTLTADAAKGLARRLLAQRLTTQTARIVNLPLRSLLLEPGDVVVLDDAAGGSRHRIRRSEVAGLRHRLLLDAVDTVTSAAVQADQGQFTARSVQPAGPTRLEILDLTSLDGTASTVPILHAAIAGTEPGWRGGVIYRSRDGGAHYDDVASQRAATIIGDTENPLAPASPHLWDEHNSLTVRLMAPEMTLSGATRLAVLNGGNRAVVGDEVIQFRHAELLDGGAYRLTGLLRGRGGTEWAIDHHQAGERFVLLSSAGLLSVQPLPEDIDRTILLRAVSVPLALDSAPDIAYPYRALALRPLAPVHLRAVRETSGDWRLSWRRRSRVAAGWLDGVDMPLGEAEERYDGEILSGGALLRSFTRTTPDYRYGLADQIDDGAGGPLTLRVYQRGALVGRGHPAELIFAAA